MPLPPPVEETTRKAGACWVDLGDGAHLVWHAWHDGAVWLVCGGQEQDLPGAATGMRARVTVRSRNQEVCGWDGELEVVAVGSPRWPEAVAVLHDTRCNAPDGEAQPERWARESRLVRILPAP